MYRLEVTSVWDGKHLFYRTSKYNIIIIYLKDGAKEKGMAGTVRLA